jgi:hypothetical protein
MDIYGMTQEEIAKELRSRINDDIKHFNGELPKKYSVAWNGYIAGLYEWKVITLSDYKNLVDILPSIGEPDPIAEIFLGRDNDDE